VCFALIVHSARPPEPTALSGKLSDEPNGIGCEDAGYYLKLTVELSQLSLQISILG
jgi:hypothetical protein